MSDITYSQLQELVMKIPAGKLALAYNLLINLSKNEEYAKSPQENFMLLPLNERRRIMEKQAKDMILLYEREKGERDEWQGGDFLDEY
jgi:hypothetical protein